MVFCEICERNVRKVKKFKGYGYSLYVCKNCIEGKGERTYPSGKRVSHSKFKALSNYELNRIINLPSVYDSEQRKMARKVLKER
jgi:ribosome-binding protein aMBF1 (putative translation factor)